MTCFCGRNTPGQLWSKPKVFPRGKKFTLVPFYSARRLEKSLPLVLLENVVFVNASQLWPTSSSKLKCLGPQNCRSQSAARMYAISGGYRRLKLNNTQKKKQWNGIHYMKLYLRSTSSLEIIWGAENRKLPSEINCNYNSRPKGERAVDQKRVDTLLEELSKSNYQHFVCKFLSYRLEESCSAGPPKVSSDKENTPTPIASPPQRSEGWFHERISKVTSSKEPAYWLGYREEKSLYKCGTVL